MKKLIPILSLLFFSLLVTNACSKDEDNEGDSESTKYEIIRIQTNKGDIYLWLYDETPIHRDNFKKLANKSFYDGLIFHRVINDFMIQGGDPTGTGTGGPGYTLAAEIKSNLKHKYGAVGAARDNNPEKRSNGSQFYIVENSAGTPHLDGDYTVFGETIKGLDVVSKIASVATNSSDKPITDVVMTKLSVEKYTEKELQDNFGFSIPK